MSKDNKQYTRRINSGSGAKGKESFYKRLKYKITSIQKSPRRRNMRKERFEQLNADRKKKEWNEIKIKFVRGKNPIPQDYIPIAITPKGLIVCIHEKTDGSVHPDLAKVMFPDYKNPVVTAIAASYILVAPNGSFVVLSCVEGKRSEVQQKAIDKIAQRFEGIKISEDTISQELLKRLGPEDKKELESHGR